MEQHNLIYKFTYAVHSQNAGNTGKMKMTTQVVIGCSVTCSRVVHDKQSDFCITCNVTVFPCHEQAV